MDVVAPSGLTYVATAFDFYTANLDSVLNGGRGGARRHWRGSQPGLQYDRQLERARALCDAPKCPTRCRYGRRASLLRSVPAIIGGADARCLRPGFRCRGGHTAGRRRLFSALSPGPYGDTTPTTSISGAGSPGKPGRQSRPANTGAMLSASIATGVRSAMI